MPIAEASGAQNSVRVWGGGGPMTNVPADVTNVASVATSSSECVAVLRDGQLRRWGSGITNVPAAATNVIAVSALGYRRFLALRRDGIVVDEQGTLRASNSVAVAAADQYGAGVVQINGVFLGWDGLYWPANNTSNVVAVARGGYANVRVLFGDGTISPVPPNLSATAAGVVAMAEGNYSTFLRGDGKVISSNSESNLLAALSNVVAVASGYAHGLALRSDGSVAVWGNNTSGQTNVPAGLSNVVAIAAGDHHSLALRADGTVVAWGSNSNGQTNVPAGLTNVSVIFAGPHYSVAIIGGAAPAILSHPPDQTTWTGRPATFAVRANGGLPLRFQWQFNGEIIEGATNSSYRIESAVPSRSGVYNVVVSNARGTAISRGATLLVFADPYFTMQPTNQTVFLGANVTFRASGTGSQPVSYQWYFGGTLISGATNSILVLTNVNLGQAGHYWVTAGHAFGIRTSTVAVLTTLVLAAWGSTAGPMNKVPTNVIHIAGIASGGNNNFLIKPDGTGLFWGGDDYVRPGMHLSGYVSNIVALAAGHQFVLALLTDGSVVARGLDNSYGQLNVPVLSDIVGISAGSYHALALLADGKVAAWGDDRYGQTQVPAGLTDVVSVSAGGYHSLALRANGSIVAWGYNYYGQTNIPPGLTNVVAIAGGGHHSLALDVGGKVVGWGYNSQGQASVPVSLSNVIAIAAGAGHSLALRADGTVIGWGDNTYSQSAVPPQLRNIVAITAGYGHSMALRAEGLVAPTVHSFNAALSKDGFSLQTPTVRGRSYYLQYRDSFTDPHWRLLPPVPGDGSVKTLRDQAATSQRFYRVWQKP